MFKYLTEIASAPLQSYGGLLGQQHSDEFEINRLISGRHWTAIIKSKRGRTAFAKQLKELLPFISVEAMVLTLPALLVIGEDFVVEIKHGSIKMQDLWKVDFLKELLMYINSLSYANDALTIQYLASSMNEFQLAEILLGVKSIEDEIDPNFDRSSHFRECVVAALCASSSRLA